MLRLLLLAVLMIAGCTAMSDLKPVSKQQYVVLEQPFVRERLKGAFKDRWLELRCYRLA